MRDGRPPCPYAGANSPNTAFYNMRHTYFTRFCFLKQYVSSDLGLCCCTLYSGVGQESCAAYFIYFAKMPCQKGEGNLRPLRAGAL